MDRVSQTRDDLFLYLSVLLVTVLGTE